MRKTILITGASSGLGEEMARQFAALGHDLALCARRTDRLDALKSEIAQAHPDRRVEVRALDVNDHDAVFKVFQEFREEFGTIDRVVINAGLGKGAPLGTGRFDANRDTAMTNFVAALAQTEAALEIFRAQNDGHLVMISSMSAMRGMPKTVTTYAATKAGVAHLAEGVRADVMGTPIAVSVIYPGYIRSEMNEKVKQRALHGVDQEGGHGDRRRGREGEGSRQRAVVAVGPARVRAEAPASSDRPQTDGIVPSMSGRVVHFEIPFEDGDRARGFYADVFGWEVQTIPELDYTMVSTGPANEVGPTEPGYINGGMAERGLPLGGPTVVIDVENIEETLEKIGQHGGTTMLAKAAVGEMGFAAYFKDSEGNVVGLWQNA